MQRRRGPLLQRRGGLGQRSAGLLAGQARRLEQRLQGGGVHGAGGRDPVLGAEAQLVAVVPASVATMRARGLTLEHTCVFSFSSLLVCSCDSQGGTYEAFIFKNPIICIGVIHFSGIILTDLVLSLPYSTVRRRGLVEP